METEWLSKKVRACEGWGWVGGKWSLWATFSVLSWVAQTITSLEDLSSQIHKKCFFRGFSSSAFDTFSCIVVVVVVVVHVSTCVVTEASFTFASRPRFAVVVDVTVVVVAAVLGVICVILGVCPRSSHRLQKSWERWKKSSRENCLNSTLGWNFAKFLDENLSSALSVIRLD